jgi:hypothetical protein
VAVKFLQMMITSAPHQQFVFQLQKLLVCSFSFISRHQKRAHLCCLSLSFSLIGNKEKEINFHEQVGIIVILSAGGAAAKNKKGKPRELVR